jgi:hypothetical protein
MNNRIKELFKRAGGKTSTHNLMSNPVQHREYNELWDENITKFAELIVGEFARIGELKEQGYSEYDPDISVGWYMRQHFGVDE